MSEQVGACGDAAHLGQHGFCVGGTANSMHNLDSPPGRWRCICTCLPPRRPAVFQQGADALSGPRGFRWHALAARERVTVAWQGVLPGVGAAGARPGPGGLPAAIGAGFFTGAGTGAVASGVGSATVSATGTGAGAACGAGVGSAGAVAGGVRMGGCVGMPLSTSAGGVGPLQACKGHQHAKHARASAVRRARRPGQCTRCFGFTASGSFARP